MNEDLLEIFDDSVLGQEFATPETFQRAMRYISQNEYKQERTYAMTHFMALWHSLRNELEIASWLLWEVKAMQNYSDTATAIECLENNVIFQLMINKFFKAGQEYGLAPNFPDEGLYGQGMTNYLIYKADLELRGSLPPGLIITASRPLFKALHLLSREVPRNTR
jgi:hypothetical protein